MITTAQPYQFVKEQSLTIADVATVVSADQDFTVTGLTTDMTVVVNPTSAMPTNLGLAGARVKSANTLTLRFVNPTAGTITGAAVTFKIIAL
jgi:hypothetical protein